MQLNFVFYRDDNMVFTATKLIVRLRHRPHTAESVWWPRAPPRPLGSLQHPRPLAALRELPRDG